MEIYASPPALRKIQMPHRRAAACRALGASCCYLKESVSSLISICGAIRS